MNLSSQRTTLRPTQLKGDAENNHMEMQPLDEGPNYRDFPGEERCFDAQMMDELYYEDQREYQIRTVNIDLVERLKDERAWNLKKRAQDYAATEVDGLSQRFREAQEAYGSYARCLTWRGQKVWVYGTTEGDDSIPQAYYYCLDAIFDSEWMSVVDEVTQSELDDLERQLFNLDNLSRFGL